MRRLITLLPILALALAATAPAQDYKPKRINKAIELLDMGQPIYYTGSHNGTDATFEQGKLDAQTWADYINYDMEAAPWDIAGLAAYMKGLKAGGPTRSGHPTPAVFVVLPVRGTDEATVRANAWMVEQVLATGVHGIMLAHATTPGAVRALVEAIRYPNRENGPEGMRGVHGASMAAQIWGISPAEYQRKADLWPLNPEGELMLGVKIEDKYALANIEGIVEVPGLGFGEGGPGDMGLSFGYPRGDPRLRELEERIFKAAKAQKKYWLGVNGRDIEGSITSGHMIGSGEATAVAGRKFTKRTMPD
ncbi:MAG: aldolase/citrate lyase family protein [Acidobacteria bacterium]|nr:aldolase/citrate lyase family protein [Acidobacteriota bacterium]